LPGETFFWQGGRKNRSGERENKPGGRKNRQGGGKNKPGETFFWLIFSFPKQGGRFFCLPILEKPPRQSIFVGSAR